MLLLPIFYACYSGFVRLFLEIFLCLQRVPFIFLIFCNKMDFQKAKGSPFYNFWHCEIFQNDFFVLKLDFLSTLYPNFSRPSFFSMGLFSGLFLPKPTLLAASFFSRNEMFCEHRGLLRVFSAYRRPSSIKFSTKNIFFLIFLFFEKFYVKQNSFRCLQLVANPFGYFLAL